MNSLKSKMEVVIDKNLVANTIRLSVIITALLMGYIYSPNKTTKVSALENHEQIDSMDYNSTFNIFQ